MVSRAYLYVEGGAGGGSPQLDSRAREAVHKLLKSGGFKGHLTIVICGPGNKAFDKFKLRHSERGHTFVSMLVDSEDPVTDGERPWDHLGTRANDRWARPAAALDDQVFLMTTSMETWIIADRAALLRRLSSCLREGALPGTADLESVGRDVAYDSLRNATKDCGRDRQFEKGGRSFEYLAAVDGNALKTLPAFARMLRILHDRLPAASAR